MKPTDSLQMGSRSCEGACPGAFSVYNDLEVLHHLEEEAGGEEEGAKRIKLFPRGHWPWAQVCRAVRGRTKGRGVEEGQESIGHGNLTRRHF
jgi:hypothetical protein